MTFSTLSYIVEMASVGDFLLDPPAEKYNLATVEKDLESFQKLEPYAEDEPSPEHVELRAETPEPKEDDDEWETQDSPTVSLKSKESSDNDHCNITTKRSPTSKTLTILEQIPLGVYTVEKHRGEVSHKASLSVFVFPLIFAFLMFSSNAIWVALFIGVLSTVGMQHLQQKDGKTGTFINWKDEPTRKVNVRDVLLPNRNIML